MSPRVTRLGTNPDWPILGGTSDLLLGARLWLWGSSLCGLNSWERRCGDAVDAGFRRSSPPATSLARDSRILIVPVANPDGHSVKRRLNRNGVDLNRNFPADNRRNQKRYGDQALSEPESRALHGLIEAQQSDVMVSIHQPVTCVDYDGPESAKILAKRMADACNLPLKKLGSRPGSLGAYFGETLRRPIITLELPPLTPKDPSKLYARYGEALWEAVRFQLEADSSRLDR